MKWKTLVLIFSVALLFSNCNVLTESQVTNINAFATTAKSYSSFPSEIFRKRAELHLNNELLEASQFSDANIITRTVTNARTHYKAVMQLSDKFDLSLKLLQQYSGLLVKLSSDSYSKDLTESTQGLGENLTGLFASYNAKVETKLPEKLGVDISRLILLVGNRLTKNKQAKELQKFIPEGNTLIKVTVNNLIEVLDADSFIGADGTRYPTLKSLIFKENEDFLSNYKNIVLANTQPNGNKVSYASIQTYSNTITDYENTEILRQRTVDAAKKLAIAHDELAKDIVRKKTMSEIKKETQDLISDVQGLFKIVNPYLKKQASTEAQ